MNPMIGLDGKPLTDAERDAVFAQHRAEMDKRLADELAAQAKWDEEQAAQKAKMDALLAQGMEWATASMDLQRRQVEALESIAASLKAKAG